jgi:FixJ family two-component response regulator
VLESAGYDVDTYGSARDFLDGWERSGPACVVLDLRLPDLDGIELQRRLKDADGILATIFLTGHGSIPDSVEAMRSGAFDFLEKPVPRAKLLSAIDSAMAGLHAGEGARQRLDDLQRRYESLTPREREVLHLVVRGRLNKQIAAELGISTKTVKVHRGRMMAKMAAERLPHLMAVASELGLVALSNGGSISIPAS